MTDCLFAINVQENVDLSELMNSNSDVEIYSETLIKTVTLSNTLHCLETVEIYLMQRYTNSFESGIRNIAKHLSASILKFDLPAWDHSTYSSSSKFSCEVGEREASDITEGALAQNWGRTKSNRSLACMVLKATVNDKRKTSPLPR
ncbi:hypothetical protein TNCV_1350191 [Trichonephila clavipes]|nr:hypothetical protein TNCV_1350191 [Trichonephila clavipes]